MNDIHRILVSLSQASICSDFNKLHSITACTHINALLWFHYSSGADPQFSSLSVFTQVREVDEALTVFPDMDKKQKHMVKIIPE